MAERSASQSEQLKEIKGDLFESAPTASLAHCVSRDLHMGKGIAVLFKKKFGRVTELKDQCKEVGECAVLTDESRYIYYLVTKEKFSHKPKLVAVRESVRAMREHCVANGVGELCLPRIGCGLDKLDWSEVQRILIDEFKRTEVKLTVYSLK